MKIVNRGNYFTDNQLEEVIELTKFKCIPDKLIICENRLDVLNSFKHIHAVRYIATLLNPFIWLCKREGICYYKFTTLIMIFVYSQNDDGEDKQSKQLYSLHALSHELRHLWQMNNKFIGDKEVDADIFATKFINDKSKKIAKIMKWKDEWEVEEED